jgi:hypothetical protein
MNRSRALALRARQSALLLRSAELRGRLATDAVVLQRPLALADRVREAWRWVSVHPEAPLAALVVVAVMRPRRMLRWGWRAWTAWRRLRRLQAWLAPAR